jgi:hypothetical protein
MKMASVVTTVTRPRFPSMATFGVVLDGLDARHRGPQRSGGIQIFPDLPDAGRDLRKPRPPLEVEQDGQRLLPSSPRSTRVGFVVFWAASGTARSRP